MVSLASGHRHAFLFTAAIALCLLDAAQLVYGGDAESILDHLHLEKPPVSSSSSSSSRHDAERGSAHREIVVDTVAMRQDCGFNLLARIVAVNTCDRCPKTRARIAMISSYLLRLSTLTPGTDAATQYVVAREYLLRECRAAKDEGSQDPEQMAGAEQLSTLELVNAIPQSTWRQLSEANEGQVEAESMLQDTSLVKLLFPELQRLCCDRASGCRHADIANNCV